MATDEQLEQAREAARLAEAEVGRLRGEIVELKTQLARARQDQETFQQWFDRYRAVRGRTDPLFAGVRRRLGALRRRLTS